MPTFVDYAGMNTLILSTGSFDENNIIESQVNPEFMLTNSEDELVGINIHRNGPYGYSSWKQLRVSENPVTRNHVANSTMTFVVEPGPVMNLGQNGELRIRSRYSALYNYTEPAIAQKSYPLVWNVGRHFKDEDGNVDLDNPQKFSIVSSYGNQQIGFANEKVDKLLKFDPDEEQTEYVAIADMYLENGLNKQDSPLTYWEFLQYRETVYPHMKNQFQNENLERPTFDSFYRHNRADRTRILYSSSFGFDNGVNTDYLSQSSWPLDEEQYFLTREYSSEESSINFLNLNENESGTRADEAYSGRYGEGRLMTTLSPFIKGMADSGGISDKLSSADPLAVEEAIEAADRLLNPGPLYMRRISLANSASVSNPSGMEIYGTGSTLKLFQGGALWEAGPKRYIKDASGSYISAPRLPFYDTYEDYIEEARRRHKNFSVVPEFRMSTQVEDYLTNNIAIELDMFDVTGGVSGTTNSSDDNFYEIYSNSDFMRNFEVIDDDHKDFTNGKVLSLRCKAVKKFLPYEGFYPAQRAVDLAKRFYDSFGDNISLSNRNGVQLNDFNYGRQMVMTPLFAPGILFNTIKSGIAVDYPVVTSSLNTYFFPDSLGLGPYGGETLMFETFNKRIPFEALIEPSNYLDINSFVSNEPHPSGNLSASAEWDGQGDELYSRMANNFMAEIPSFFLPNGQFTSIVSKKQEDITLKAGSIYGMRIKMRRSMDNAREKVYHSGQPSMSYYPPQDVSSGSLTVRENFTMYSRPSAFGPPTVGWNHWGNGSNQVDSADAEIFSFGLGKESYVYGGSGYFNLLNGSLHGQNFPYTPPYYHGEAWCEIVLTASSNSMTIKDIQESASYIYKRYDSSFIQLTSSSGSLGVGSLNAGQSGGAQSLYNDNINNNAVQLSASLNIKGIGTIRKKDGRAAQGSLIVDTAIGSESRWVIQTKFETPMLNFAHVSGSDHLTLPVYGSGSVPRGMWHNTEEYLKRTKVYSWRLAQ